MSPESRSPPRLFPRTPPSQAMAVSRGSCLGRVLWRPHMPHPMLAMPSHAISCTLIPPWSSSECRNTPSTNQLHVFAFQVGRSVWLNKDYCLNTSSSSKIFRQGGNAWNLFDFDNQSAAIFCADTTKYYSIPSVPSRLEGVKTRPDSRVYKVLRPVGGFRRPLRSLISKNRTKRADRDP